MEFAKQLSNGFFNEQLAICEIEKAERLKQKYYEDKSRK
jgi:hypothetical protein